MYFDRHGLPVSCLKEQRHCARSTRGLRSSLEKQKEKCLQTYPHLSIMRSLHRRYSTWQISTNWKDCGRGQTLGIHGESNIQEHKPTSATPTSAVLTSALLTSAVPISAMPPSAMPPSSMPTSAVPTSALLTSALLTSAVPISAVPISSLLQ